MRLGIRDKAATSLLKERNFAYVMVVFLMVVSVTLLAKLWTSKERIIVVPTLASAEKFYRLEGGHLPDSYLVDWASALVTNLLTANPENVDLKNAAFLQWVLSSSSLSEKLQKTADLLKKEQISTAFFPEKFEILREKRKVFLKGRFLTYLGKSVRPVVVQKSFVLGWKMMPSGLITIETFEEEARDAKN